MTEQFSRPDNKGNTYLILALLFLVSVLGVFAFRFWQVKKMPVPSFSPQKSSFSLKPPTEALKGEFLTIKGDVKKEPRDKEEFETVKTEGEVLIEGEKIATGEKSQATIEFPDFIKIDLGSDTEIGLANLMPANFLINQLSGSVTYRLLQNDNAFSVRSLHALITFDSGESEISVEGNEIKIEVLSGKAKLALVDLDNKTHIWELNEGEEVLVDDAERRVEIK
ncbi:FecR domain-containing protein [Candidatus Microgenomates bacterium]|nr:FecR domain-containing protein [Candidatus Microgenomates bacterium]